MTFYELGLCAPILTALKEQDYEVPSPIQEKAIPPALAGRDVLGCAQTGTGKTCAFAAPILQRLADVPTAGHPIRALVLTPTRELAIQISESFEAYGRHLNLRHTVIFGGVGQNPQVEALKRGVDILIATPGRLMDLHNQGFVSLDRLEIFVLDEADRMLDMGFIHDVKKILKWLPEQKQTLFFSATMPPEISDLVNSLLKKPVRVAVNPISSPVEAIRQSVYLVDKANKTRLLAHLVQTLGVKNALVFTRTKHGANKVARDLEKTGISAAAIHGNKSQTARQQALTDFKSGKIQCLVATDIAARGLDIEELSHVFNYNLPEVPETYVHRIGRTGRAGRGGEAIALCDFSEKPLLRDIEKLIGRKVPQTEGHPFPMEVFEAPKKDQNGRTINEEDAEARAAARELRREREAAKKAAVARNESPVQSQSLSGTGEKKPAHPRRRKKKAKAEPSQSAVASTPEQPARSVPRAERPRLTRSGNLMDTGEAMPCTEFHRPNPLDSDVIMDATARLLAPRRLTVATSAPQHEEKHGGNGASRNRRGKNGGAPQTIQPTVSVKSVGGEQAHRPAHKNDSKTHASAPRQRHTASSSKGNRDRGGHREGPTGSHKSQPKDSTEQPSLMKPYYLDIGR